MPSQSHFLGHVDNPADAAYEPPKKRLYSPVNCPHCEYDRRFPETATGGWMYVGNGAPIVCCPVCNPDAAHPRC
jgi:hypothetical protein